MTIDEVAVSVRRHRIDRHIYRDEGVFDAERRLLFARTWQYAGFESDLREPGAYRAVEIAGQPIVVARHRDGEIKAFANTCTHRGSLLATAPEGNCGGVLKCMYHGWAFDTAGRCIGIPYPAAYGAGFDRHEFDAPAVRVDTHAGMVFVNLDPEAPPLDAFLGRAAPLLEETCGGMEVIGRLRYRFNANWKTWHENFTDGYHPDFAHRWVHDFQSTYPAEGVNEHLGGGHAILTWLNETPEFERYNAALGRVTGFDHAAEGSALYRPPEFAPLFAPTHSRVWAMFPNVDFQSPFRTPVVEVLHPLTPGSTLVEVVFLGAEDDTPEQRQWRLDNVGSLQASSGKIAADDNEAIQRCQAGFAATLVARSDMSRGQAAGEVGETRDEHGMRGFYREWGRYLGIDGAAW